MNNVPFLEWLKAKFYSYLMLEYIFSFNVCRLTIPFNTPITSKHISACIPVYVGCSNELFCGCFFLVCCQSEVASINNHRNVTWLLWIAALPRLYDSRFWLLYHQAKLYDICGRKTRERTKLTSSTASIS